MSCQRTLSIIILKKIILYVNTLYFRDDFYVDSEILKGILKIDRVCTIWTLDRRATIELSLRKGGIEKMGILDFLFDDSGPSSKASGGDYTPSKNSAEAQASADYMSESLNTGKDPIPDMAPDWAKDIGPKK
ncbi:MAG: hypothetical protein A3A90_01720 [Candidatus Zambryskibacteria bacterium RIFCSPLOWO2_01_FULL_35_19]|uniref:Uncharacterized protein n=1 Tax=Candidatus Zambryskibacteria bacterium RIFCSPLOWO2_01_FULL_35_19 TaxID=1802757 RepID=A0A1G2TZB1_9BACT|nr:MAG: hypothetical protein A3A90_01720 [Candidatus Zambryskibacteria bacterium RIFCSPLOWO2_01_FULL_35_19]